jgi:hypothetical protein
MRITDRGEENAECGLRIAEPKTQSAIMILNLEFEIRLTSFRNPHSAFRISFVRASE